MAAESMALDRVDHAIIGELRADGRLSWRELSQRVHLSPTSAADRVRRLEALGVITGYHATVDGQRLGRTLRAVVDVDLPDGTSPETFEAWLAERGDEIVFAAFVTGGADYTIVADCEGAEGLDRLIRWLKQRGAAKTHSKVVLRHVVG